MIVLFLAIRLQKEKKSLSPLSDGTTRTVGFCVAGSTLWMGEGVTLLAPYPIR